jgi:RNA polymerase sigma factor (sigma-70 family)
VYAVNLRRLRDPHLAQDATQAVFIALARKADRVARGPSVVGWLHRSSCYESRNLMRAQFNRTARETEAERLGTTVAAAPEAGPPGHLEAMLDEVLDELTETDRDAILARFFSQRTYAEIGAATGSSENAARMRVDRALARLRERLERRGFKSSAVLLASLLPACATAAVPGGLAGTVATTALAAGTALAGPAAFLAFMSTPKIMVTAGALAVAGFVGFEMVRTNTLRDELTAMRRENGRANERVLELEKQVAGMKSRPAHEATAGEVAAVRPPVKPAAAVAPVETKGVKRGAPAGWFKNGNRPEAFEVGVDENNAWGGMPSAYVKSIADGAREGFGGLGQSIAADNYKNKRVRLSGWIKTEEATGGGGQMWLRVDGPGQSGLLEFDNMAGRAPKGTSDWQEYSVVLDVPENAASLNYGFFLAGTGQVWVNAVTIEPVGSDVPTTAKREKRKPVTTPQNLGFKTEPPGGG